MSGIFVVGEEKTRPGTYWRRENSGGVSVAGASAGIGACAFKSEWGPLNVAIDAASTDDLVKLIGTGLTGYATVTELFNGGVNEAILVRAGNGGTAGSVTLKDNASADVVKLTNKYVGARTFTVTVRDSVSDDTKKQVILYEGTTERESFTFAAGTAEVDGIIAAMADSEYVIPSKVAAGSGKLADVTQQSETTGTNPTVSAAEYSAAFAVAEAETWNGICVDTDDSAILALLQAFVDRIFQDGSLPIAAVGEGSTVALAKRITNAAANNDEKMVYVLNGWKDASGKVYEGHIAAARICGMMTSGASNTTLTHATIKGAVALSESLTNAQINQALTKGCLVISMSKQKNVWIEQGINTLNVLSADLDEGWKKIRRVKTRFELIDRVNKTVEAMSVDNDSNGRAAVVAAANAVIAAMIGENKLLTGTEAVEDANNPAEGDSAWFVIAVLDKDSLEKTYLTFKFQFSAPRQPNKEEEEKINV